MQRFKFDFIKTWTPLCATYCNLDMLLRYNYPTWVVAPSEKFTSVFFLTRTRVCFKSVWSIALLFHFLVSFSLIHISMSKSFHIQFFLTHFIIIHRRKWRFIGEMNWNRIIGVSVCLLKLDIWKTRLVFDINASSLLNIICRQIWYQRKSDCMDRARVCRTRGIWNLL